MGYITTMSQSHHGHWTCQINPFAAAVWYSSSITYHSEMQTFFFYFAINWKKSLRSCITFDHKKWTDISLSERFYLYFAPSEYEKMDVEW